MVVAQVVQPTITEPGAGFSRGVLDHAAHALAEVKDEFAIPPAGDPILGSLVTKLRFLRGHLFGLLDSAKGRLDLHRAQSRKVGQQLENGTKRYDDLPQPVVPFEFLGPTLDVDRIRQKILDERARLLEEQRRLDDRYWSDVVEIRASVAEVLAEYVQLAGRVEALTGQPVPVPALDDVFAFMGAPEPEEVIVLNTPHTVSDRLPLLDHLP